MTNEKAIHTLAHYDLSAASDLHEAINMAIAALRTPPATGAAMRDACLAVVRDVMRDKDVADVCAAEEIGLRIAALPAPEVPEAVRAWCGHFRTCVANSDEEDIWPEADFNLLAYFEKEYPDA